METEKNPLKEKRFFPVLFIVVLSVIFISVLAFIYNSTSERVSKYNEKKEMTQILSLFSINSAADQVEETFKNHIKIETKKYNDREVKYYSAHKDEIILGYCYKIRGSGLWGKIDALLALSKDKNTLIGLLIVEQNETPGLGARIGENDFLKQFKNKTLKREDVLIKYSLIAEETDEAQVTDSEIRQITGATASSNAIVKMIYNEMQFILQSETGENREKAEQ